MLSKIIGVVLIQRSLEKSSLFKRILTCCVNSPNYQVELICFSSFGHVHRAEQQSNELPRNYFVFYVTTTIPSFLKLRL